MTIQNKWMFCLKLHSCYGRQSIAAQNGCFQWSASKSFLSVPRSLFAPDGKMLHYFAKSALMTIFGGESEQRVTSGPQISANERVNMEPSSQLRVAVVDAKNWQNVNLSARRSISKTVRNELRALLPESPLSTSPMMRSVWFSIDMTSQSVWKQLPE